MLNLRLARELKTLTVYGELLNLLDHKGKDIVYFYENAFDPQRGAGESRRRAAFSSCWFEV
ncbi:MAG: hypothetical protein V4660_05565 [Pseudomonadota bacterium]